MKFALWFGLLICSAQAQPRPPWKILLQRSTEARGPSRYLELRVDSSSNYFVQSTTTGSTMRRKPFVRKRQGKLNASQFGAIQQALQAPGLWRQEPLEAAVSGPTQTTLSIHHQGSPREFSSASGTLGPASKRLIQALEAQIPNP